MTVPIPDDEGARLAVLRGYKILDTPPEEAFDDLTHLASFICGAPIALVSLVDAHRQWFKSRVGLDVPETPRDVAFCAHSIMQPDVLVVPDARADARFAEIPLVTGDTAIRFYASATLTSPEGYNLGTLCVMDRVPRNLSPEQREGLRMLGRQVMRQIELRRHVAALQSALTARDRAERTLRQNEARLQDFFDNANDLLQITSPHGELVYVNRTWRETLGYDEDDLAVLTLLDIIDPDKQAECIDYFWHVMEGEQLPNLETVFVARTGEKIPVEGSINCQMIDGQPASIRAIFRNLRDGHRPSSHQWQHFAMFNAFPDLLYLIAADGTYLDYQAAPQQSLLAPRETILGKTVYDIMPGQLAERVMYFIQQVIETGEPQTFEYQLLIHEVMRDYEARLVSSGPDSVLAIIRDITPRASELKGSL